MSVHPSWIHCSAQRKTYHPMIPIWHRIHRSFFTIAFCILYDRPIFCTKLKRTTSLQVSAATEFITITVTMAALQAMHSSSMLNKNSKYSLFVAFGLNLGPSPHHARNLNLMLNLISSLVSPQFHCQYNDFFETISLNKPETMMSSNWQILAGLERPDKTLTVKQVLQRARPPQPIAPNANLSIPDQNPGHIPDEPFININDVNSQLNSDITKKPPT
ncbi:hypothetical protein ACHAW6_001420, partial [Cyclotella cf. meneghiniana]